MTTDEIRALITKTITSSGNVVLGGILNAMCDSIAAASNSSGSGGVDVIESTADWGNISMNGVTYQTKSEAAEAAGISEETLDAIIAGDKQTSFFCFKEYLGEDEYSNRIFAPSVYHSEDGYHVQYWTTLNPESANPQRILIELSSLDGYMLCGLSWKEG